MAKSLRLVLGDQLNIDHSWFKQQNNDHLYMLMEVLQESNYVQHHIQKVMAFFGAMRRFANQLSQAGHRVIYLKLDDPKNEQSFRMNLLNIIKNEGIEEFSYQEPDEYRLDIDLKAICNELDIPHAVYNSEHFLTDRLEMKEFFERKKSKQWLMESFYRQMRKKHHLLLEQDGSPEGGKWNFDKSNRKSLPKGHKITEPFLFDHDLTEIFDLIQKKKVKTIGNVEPKNFKWPLDREESLELLDFFLQNCLQYFGDYQDAMSTAEWSLYHSRLSFSLNSKMICPKELVDRVIQFYRNNKDKIDISQVEGFVRQIIGWREYMRGIYWAKMPEYENENQLNNHRSLPGFYWDANTKMNCVKQAVKQSLDHAYAHHIQRLMVTGNFALLAGCKPQEVDRWYLGIYIDAIQWVELPNTRGMSQFADGGLVATKPYVSSANYINKMSDHCSSCAYSHSKKYGEGSCPFNSLYWNFIDQHMDKWEKNQRMSMIVNNWKKRDQKEKVAVLEQAKEYLEHIDSL